MRINTNMNAMTALNSMNKNTNLAGAAMGKISSGLRINKAGDDAAGLAISEKMRSQIRGLDQASRNTQDGVSLIQTAEGATEEIGNITQRMRELSVQASNETNSGSDRSKIVEELNQLHSEIDRIADSTQFNGKNLLNGTTKIGTVGTFTTDAGYTIEGLDGISTKDDIKLTLTNGAGANQTNVTIKVDGKTFTATDVTMTGAKGTLDANKVITLKNGSSSITFKVDKAITTATTDSKIGETKVSDVLGGKVDLQVGANEGQQLLVQINNLGTESLGIAKADIDAIEADNESGCKAAQKMITTLDKALEKVNTSRANFGAMQNRLESAQSNLSTSSENLTAAESRIRDVDVAKEMMTLSKFNLLTQASQAMAAQAKSQPEGIMQLLR
ncbi:flagellin [Clostridium sardiniense]|uniref:Flagellin n=1 Tax=Clostridium sardiniense TaxID=29369 RepID=A0ABS7KVM6_CLOSR|nr:flagellin [Clostridium sardiniense]MBY0754668.1 flagellin [Clostridium sardiniense]MDQ0460612.1 flagellin [Clostridium sardiniense]